MDKKIKIICDNTSNSNNFLKIFEFLIEELDYDYGNLYNKLKLGLKKNIYNNTNKNSETQKIMIGYVEKKNNNEIPNKKNEIYNIFCIRKNETNYYLENGTYEKYINIFFNKNSQKIMEKNINSNNIFFTKIFVRNNSENYYFKNENGEELQIDICNFNMEFENKINEEMFFFINFTFLFEEFDFSIEKNSKISSLLNDKLELYINSIYIGDDKKVCS